MFGMKNYSHIDHGYAATVHKSQGVTVDRAHLLATRSLDRHATYVAMTRHRDRLDVHWSEDVFKSAAKFRRDVSRAAVKDTSLDYGDQNVPPPASATAPPVDRQDRAAPAAPLRQHWEAPRQPVRPQPAPDGRDRGMTDAPRPATPAPSRPDLSEIAARLEALRAPFRRQRANSPQPPKRLATVRRDQDLRAMFTPEAVSRPDKPITEADRLEALRTHGLRSQWPPRPQPAARPSTAKPASLIRRVGDRALARLQRAAAERAARETSRDASARPAAGPAQSPALALPRPDDMDRVSIFLTAEMLAYDHETAALSAAMVGRHQAEIDQEQGNRAWLTVEAAEGWAVAGMEHDEPDREIEQERNPRRPPAPGLDL